MIRHYLYRKLFVPINNFYFLHVSPRSIDSRGDAAFAAARDKMTARSDVSDHLPRLYREARLAKLIVELGTRGGESTLSLLAAARQNQGVVLSVDVEDVRGSVNDPGLLAHWRFVCSDDIEFERRFADWCGQNGVNPEIDLLFVDTSHLYEHTRQEIAAWWPHLAPAATVIFHDTNLKEFYRRADGTIGRGWDNDRGVIRAIEEHFGTVFDETRSFQDKRDGWLIEHDPLCNGLTVLKRDAKQ